MQSPDAQRHLRNAPGGQLEAAGLLSGGGGGAQPQQRQPNTADGVQLPGSLGEVREQAEDSVSRIAQVQRQRWRRCLPAGMLVLLACHARHEYILLLQLST